MKVVGRIKKTFGRCFTLPADLQRHEVLPIISLHHGELNRPEIRL